MPTSTWGHVLFDTRRYSEARDHLEKVDPEYFVGRTQQWRVIKNAELILCCRLQTEWARVRPDEVDALCAQYETNPAVEFIVPREIVLCIDELMASNSHPQQAESYARRVIAMLERTDNLRVNYLRESIARLSRVVSPEAPPNLPHEP